MFQLSHVNCHFNASKFDFMKANITYRVIRAIVQIAQDLSFKDFPKFSITQFTSDLN